MPGIGTTSGPCASSQPSASCAGVSPQSRAIASNRSTTIRLRDRPGSTKRGIAARMSPGSYHASRTPPASRPRDTGEKATSAMPSARQVSSTATSTLRDAGEYSLCTAAIGWTAWARV